MNFQAYGASIRVLMFPTVGIHPGVRSVSMHQRVPECWRVPTCSGMSACIDTTDINRLFWGFCLGRVVEGNRLEHRIDQSGSHSVVFRRPRIDCALFFFRGVVINSSLRGTATERAAGRPRDFSRDMQSSLCLGWSSHALPVVRPPLLFTTGSSLCLAGCFCSPDLLAPGSRGCSSSSSSGCIEKPRTALPPIRKTLCSERRQRERPCGEPRDASSGSDSFFFCAVHSDSTFYSSIFQ